MAQEPAVWTSPQDDPIRVIQGSDVHLSGVWDRQQEGAQTHEPATQFFKHGKIDNYDLDAKVPYVHVNVLGRGNSGLVEKVQHESTKQIYARKSMAIPRKRQAEQESIFLNEVAVIRRLCDHHHFIKVVAAYKTRQNFGIILFPVAENGDLGEYLWQYHELRESSEKLEVADPRLKTAETELKAMTAVLKRAFGCLTSGLAFMHEQRIRHKDIKPQNVLVHAGSVLFTDFGYSLDCSRFSHSATEGRPSFLTRRYCAREVLEHERRDSSSDVWSLGCVLIEVLCALTSAIEIDENRIFSEAMPKIHADLVSTSISDEYLPLVDNLVDMTSLEATMRPTSKAVWKSLSIHHTFSCHECRSPQPLQWSEVYQRHFLPKYNFTTHVWDIDWNVSPDGYNGSRVDFALSGGTRARARQGTTLPSSTDDARKLANAPGSLLGEGDKARPSADEVALNNPNQVSAISTRNEMSVLPRGKGQSIVGEYVQERNLHYETLDFSYQVRHARFFTEGKVIAVMWNETAGTTIKPIDYNSSRSLSAVKDEGNIVYTNVRQFVVVRRKREFCYACPIFTYGRRGCTKNGVITSEHAIVYSWNDTPKIVQGETGFTKPHVPVVMADGVPNLHFASRIYFGIQHPIQYNVKVKDIGYVPAENVQILIDSWREENQGTNQALEVIANAD